MKTPKSIKALAVIDKKKLKINIFDLYLLTDKAISKGKDEVSCLVEIKFIKYIK